MFWLGGTGGPQQKAAAAGAGIGWDSRNSAASGWAVAIRVLSKPRPQRPPRTPPCRGMAQVAHGCATTRVRTGMSARGMGHAPAGRRPPPKPAPRSNAPRDRNPRSCPTALAPDPGLSVPLSVPRGPAADARGPCRRCFRAPTAGLPASPAMPSCPGIVALGLAADAPERRHQGFSPRRRCSLAPTPGLPALRTGLRTPIARLFRLRARLRAPAAGRSPCDPAADPARRGL